jgi:orotidine-5'-phosphate decarboxylase
MFSTRLNQKSLEKNSRLCVGLDPRLDLLPPNILAAAQKEHGSSFEAAGQAILEFNRQVIEVVAPLVPAIKPQLAFYEQYGPPGMVALQETVKYAHEHDLLVIADAKRGDIGSTAEAYANAILGTANLFGTAATVYNFDCSTINPFLGEDSLLPFFDVCQKSGKGVFVLVKTSNPGSVDFQDLSIDGKTISTLVAKIIAKHASKTQDSQGYSSIGAVVGATFPQEAQLIRKQLPHSIFLVPGLGAQGGSYSSLPHFFNPDKLGAIVNSSRGITFSQPAGSSTDFRRVIEAKTKETNKLINQELGL